MPKNKKSQGCLGVSAVDQILLAWNEKQPKKRLNDQEMDALREKIEASCNRYDRKERGKLTADELYNVVKMQNKVDCSKDDIKGLVEDLGPDRDGRVAIKAFMSEPIVSQAVFDAMDRNKDGFVSKGELKLAKKGCTLQELNDVINEVDKNSDGKLTFEEVRAINRKARAKKNADKK